MRQKCGLAGFRGGGYHGVAMRNLFSVAIVCCVLAPAVLADDFVDKANALYSDIEASKRSDTILLPALAKLDAVPAVVGSLEQAKLLTASSSAWAQAAAWAEGANQKAALAALAKATAPESTGVPLAFGQPYGVEAVSPDLVRTKMYTDLGDPPMLSGAQQYYIKAMDTLVLLTNVEATRRLSVGDVDGAVQVMWDQMILGRQMADRQFYREAKWGFEVAIQGLERVRDLAYQDDRGARKLSDAKIKDLVRRMDPLKGDVRIDRIHFPRAERLGAEQAIGAVYVPRGSVDPKKFSIVMSRVGAGDAPLRRFGESAHWRTAAATQKNWFDATDILQRVYSDFEGRWPLDWFDQRNQVPFFMNKVDRASLAVLDVTLGDLSPLFALRQVLRTEVVGTQQSLATMGYARESKAYPPLLSSVRGRDWIQSLEADPFNPNRQAGGRPPMQYFVPIRDTKDRFGAQEDPRPHEITIVTEQGANFKLSLSQDTFVMYSMGSDYKRDWAERIQNTAQATSGADYLIWPPVLSLYRQHLMDTGELK